jgi:hypothetical protein
MTSCPPWIALLTTIVLLAAAPPVLAQDAQSPVRRAAPDFLFGEPNGSVTVRGSWLFSRGRSDWYEFVTDHLTLSPRDFNAPGFGVDVNVPFARRADVQFAFDLSRSRDRSEYRDLVDNNRLPIEQTTTLRSLNMSANVRLALTDRGQAVGRLAWIPSQVVPFVGAGVGVTNHSLVQTGDFVDFVDNSVFNDTLESHGWAPSAQVFGSVDVRVLTRLNVTVDARYLWSSAELGGDWIGFEPLDLNGLRLSTGINFTF